jgi:uncharacterized coiled-coil protein SlyX
MQSEVTTTAETTTKALTDLLGRVVEKATEIEKASAQLKVLKAQLEELEQQAAASLESAGVDGLRCHGKTWWTGIDLHISTLAGDREKVLAAAKRVNLDAVSVNTSRIKGWLVEEYERRRDEGTVTERYAEGTPFDGLIKEYTERRLCRRAV